MHAGALSGYICEHVGQNKCRVALLFEGLPDWSRHGGRPCEWMHTSMPARTSAVSLLLQPLQIGVCRAEGRPPANLLSMVLNSAHRQTRRYRICRRRRCRRVARAHGIWPGCAPPTSSPAPSACCLSTGMPRLIDVCLTNLFMCEEASSLVSAGSPPWRRHALLKSEKCACCKSTCLRAAQMLPPQALGGLLCLHKNIVYQMKRDTAVRQLNGFAAHQTVVQMDCGGTSSHEVPTAVPPESSQCRCRG